MAEYVILGLQALIALATIAGGIWLRAGSTYWNERAKNAATHDDIDKLRQQMVAVTEATKTIEAKISNDVWERQRKWEVKREALFEATRQLGSVEYGLAILEVTCSSTQYQCEANTAQRRAATETWNKALLEFKCAKALSMLVCGEELQAAFESLQQSITTFANSAVSGDGNMHGWYAELKSKNAALTVLVRKELRLDPITLQSSESSAVQGPD